MLRRMGCRGDLLHTSHASLWTSELKFCLIADLLMGSIFGVCDLVFNDLGRRFASDVSPLTALLACSSAASFPNMPMCPADHLITILLSSGFGSIAHRSLWNVSIR